LRRNSRTLTKIGYHKRLKLHFPVRRIRYVGIVPAHVAYTVYSATTPKVGNVGNGNVPTTPTSNSKLVYDKNNSNWDDSDDDNVVLLGKDVLKWQRLICNLPLVG